MERLLEFLGACPSLRDGEAELGEGSHCSMLLGKKGVAVLCWPSREARLLELRRRQRRS
jgi:hypothetical protein